MLKRKVCDELHPKMKLQVGRNQIIRGLVYHDELVVLHNQKRVTKALKAEKYKICFRSLTLVAMVGLGLEAESIQSCCIGVSLR